MILRQFPYECVDLIITSPPYDNLRDYEGYEFDFYSAAVEMRNVIKPGGIIVWVVGDACINGSESGSSFEQVLFFKKLGLTLHDTMIYWKNSFAFPESNRYAQNFEYMFVMSKGKPKTTNIVRVPTNQENRIKNKASSYRNRDGTTSPTKYKTGNDMRNRENIWAYECGFMKSSKDPLQFKHPASFPELLVSDHIISWSNPEDIVLDPFMGSGTTLKMAKQLNRKAIGVEIEGKYCELAVKRLRQGVLALTSQCPEVVDLPALEIRSKLDGRRVV